MQWARLLSSRRLGKPEADPRVSARTAFQRDFDRLVFSSAFRRLQDKTQVFPLSENDYVRTRLTHSLEAASVGRSLGTQVGERVLARRPELCERFDPADFGAIVAAACLCHDIGNPPFGHTGEDAIRHWFEHSPLGRASLDRLADPAQCADFLAFEGNAQGFRIVTRLQTPANHGGMQLTCATLGTFTKYPRAAWPEGDRHGAGARKHGFFQDDAPLFAEVAETLGLLPRHGQPQAWHRHPLAFLVEAADDICYRVIDLEDAFRLGLLGYHEVAERLAATAGSAVDSHRLNGLGNDKERIEYLRARAINGVVDQAVEAFMAHEEAILDGRFDDHLLDHIPSRAGVDSLLELAMEKVYVAHQVVEIEAAGFRVMGGLLDTFVEAVEQVAEHGARAPALADVLIRLVPEQFIGRGRTPATDPYRRILGLTDFVAGMTDSYAISLFKKITGISLPGR